MPPIPFDKSNFGGVTLSDAAPPPPHSSLPPSPESLSNTTSAATITDSLSTRPSSLSPPRPELQRRASAEELSRLQHQQHGDFHSFTAQTEAPLPSPSPAPITPPPPASQAPPTTTVPVIIKQQAPEIPPLGSSERVERKSSSWSWSFRKSKSEQLRHQESTAPRNSAPSSLTAGRKSPEPRPSVSTDSGGGKLFGLSSLFSRKSSPSKAQSTSYSSTAVPKDFQLNKINQNRLPIHIERAVYRLSHTKLANPRRPLHEQVLISNLMFWYLSIVSPSQPVPNGSNGGGGGRVVDSGRKFIHAGKKGRRRPSSQQQKVSKGGGAPPQEQNNNATLHLYMSNNASTGFVIPENYLRPQTRPKHRKPSLSDSDDDEDDQISDSSSSSSSSGSDEDGDDEPSKGVLATMAGRKSKSRQQKLTKSKKASSSLPKHTHSVTKTKGGGGDDDIPLAMCRKTKT
ncbi:hypothetical protein BX666DRAFT_300023 [Dichotomocladium elegans]|nr:hypothetical protein BX666DRAFT_300023 [Dichotomocladium elegans]